MNKISNLFFKHKRITIFLIFLLSIVYVLLYIKPTTIKFDENYTMSLIKYNYGQILQLDKLDVHPPLYYLALKFFLNITTFWTSYLPIIIIFSRLFSLISSIISLIFLYKSVKILKIQNNFIITWLTFIILPNGLGFSFYYQNMTNLRMYALASMFISIEFYYLLKFRVNSNNINLIIALIAASLASYTHYYSAIFAGLLLLLYFFKYILNHNVNKSLKTMISGILFGIFFLPWLGSLIKQMSIPQTFWISYSLMAKHIVICSLCILFFIYPIIKYYRSSKNILFKEQISLILSILIITIIFSIIFGIFDHPTFLIRYMYPLLLIYEFIGFNVTIKLLRNKLFVKSHLYYIFILISLILNSSVSVVYQIPHYLIPSINAVKQYNYWNNSNNINKKIYITNKEMSNNKNNLDFNFANILYSKNKDRFYISKERFTNYYSYDGNIAFKNVFDNYIKKINVNS